MNCSLSVFKDNNKDQLMVFLLYLLIAKDRASRLWKHSFYVAYSDG